MTFERLKTRNDQRSVFNNGILPAKFSRSPGTSSSVTKTNEATRLVRCKHCGWICDRERDVRSEDGSYTGLGIKYGEIQYTDAYKGDTDDQLKLNSIATTTVTTTSSVTKTITSRLSAFYGFDGGNGLDGVTTQQESGSFQSIHYGSSKYQLMHNRIINSIHLAVASAPGAGKEIQAVVCVNNQTTDMRAVVTGTATYAVSASSALETGAYAPVKIQFNYDESPTLSMFSYSMVLEGSGEQTYHGPSLQQNRGANGWGMHGAEIGSNLVFGQGNPYMYSRTVQIGTFKDLYVKTAVIPAASTTSVAVVAFSQFTGAFWWSASALATTLDDSGTTFSDTTTSISSTVGEWIGQNCFGQSIDSANQTAVITQISFVPQTSKHFQYFLAASNIGEEDNLTNYMPMVGVGRQVYTTSAQIDAGTYPEPFALMPMGGTIKGMTVEVHWLPPATSPLVYTMRKNGADTGITLTIDTVTSSTGLPYAFGYNHFFSVSTAEISVVTGDKISCSVTAGTDGDVAHDGCMSWTFVPDDDNVYPVFYNGLIPINVPAGSTTTETYTVLVSTTTAAVGDAYSIRDNRSGCPSCGSLLYDTDAPFQEVKFDV